MIERSPIWARESLGIHWFLIFIFGLSSCTSIPVEQSELRYFASPEQAVILITELLRKEDWKTLSRYYDLTGSSVDRGELESGRFFVRTERPATAHPAGLWRYKHPFAPGFRFDHVRPIDDPNVIAVVVSIEIDQGGGVKQRGLSEFKMRKSVKGYQILPP